MRYFVVLLCVLLTYPLSSFAQSFTLALDANSASGNQSVLSVNASANQSVSIQVFGNGLTDANAVNMRFEFDANQVTYESFTAGSALPGAQALPSQGTGFVEVGMASFGGRATASSGMLGTIGFRTTASFDSGSIRLVRGELRGRGSPIVIMPNLTIALSSALSPDFDGNGEVGFNDFVLFAGAFGAKRGENRFDARFDLDSSGDIGFGDFVEFAGSFGQPVGTGGGGSGNSGGEGSGSGGGGGSPDLIVELPSVSDNTLSTVQTFTLSATVRNAGNAPSAGTSLRYYQSSDASISTGDTRVGEDDISNLPASVTSAESISLTAPSNAGTYYYGACVASVRGESNTNNNCSAGVRVTVSVSSKMYWVDYGSRSIRRANLDGSNAEDVVRLFGTGMDPNSIALDVGRGKIYWSFRKSREKDGVQRANLDGSNVEEIFTRIGYSDLGDIALDVSRGKMYLAYRLIYRANLDGSDVENIVLNDLFRSPYKAGPSSIALDVSGGKVYYAEMEGSIFRTNLDGSNPEDLVDSSLTGLGAGGIALDVGRGKMYWIESGNWKIRRADLAGYNAEDIITFEEARVIPQGIALDVGREKIYWVAENGIHRANFDGSNVERINVATRYPTYIVLDLSGQ